jgi:hypothetical protein
MLKNQRESLSTIESLLSENQNQMELYQTGPKKIVRARGRFA